MLLTLAPQRRQGISELLAQYSASELYVVAGEGLVGRLDLEQEMSLETLLFLYLRVPSSENILLYLRKPCCYLRHSIISACLFVLKYPIVLLHAI